ncbi:hypothetical protein [Agrococcus sp. SGAir0287]|uniref:hypothetical protein n=1 Tax=Agrococcus sp. SGAir0287 TaxID=2070347 RepID=UPI0010CCF239|nr:hypothetical protein [Agrococcus sp. SGAir0287]QCR20092.1 hypothetical protein C1N71_12115 [Agrococcus sp. SGAir0287]
MIDRAAIEAAIAAVDGVAAATVAEAADGAPWRTALVVRVDLEPGAADAPGPVARGALAALAGAGDDLPRATISFTTHRPHEERLDARRIADAAGLAALGVVSRRSIVVGADAVRDLR